MKKLFKIVSALAVIVQGVLKLRSVFKGDK